MAAMAAADLFAGSGELSARMRAIDWSATALGPVESWPLSLKTCVRILLTSRQPMFVWWGDSLINFYNDAYISIVGGKHPWALGQPAQLVWAEIWDSIGPRAMSAMRDDRGTYDENLLLIMERNGYPEETYYTFSYSPVPNSDGGAGGILCANSDETLGVIGERRLATLRDLAERTAAARGFELACENAMQALAGNPRDFPFALLYGAQADASQAQLLGTAGIASGHALAPPLLVAGDRAAVWPLGEPGAPQPVCELAVASHPPAGAWTLAPQQAVVLPIVAGGRRLWLVAALNPHRLFDASFQDFVDLLGVQIAAAVNNAQAFEDERRRAEALAEIDLAKTRFFSNISHELRTPLTLMLGPLEDLLDRRRNDLIPEAREALDTVHRNGLRLLRLVNTLLDFSRLEAGAVLARPVAVDLASLTRDLASLFRSAMEKAGLDFEVDCPPLPRAVLVDREHWEKIVFNLLSNAFKYTFEGGVYLSLAATENDVRLSVRDTGTGIPPADLARVFERFHRVENARGRTHEGTGIGLALVSELARLQGGRVSVDSALGVGSTFTVTLPLLPFEAAAGIVPTAVAQIGASAQLADEALRWLPEPAQAARAPVAEAAERACILVADDNADMRTYLQGLLGGSYRVVAVADGEAALQAIAEGAPDLLITDVMMPRLDGFGLLRALRADPSTAALPLVMLSARAGEEARIEALEAGADDYLVKPFAARGLLARVATQLSMARLRSEALARLRAEAALALAASELRDSEQRFRQMADHAPMMVWVSAPDGQLTYASRSWFEFTGARPGAGALAETYRYVHPDDLDRVASALAQAHADHQPLRFDYRLRHADGDYRFMLNIGTPRHGESGEFLGFVGSVVDVTRERQREEEARNSAQLYRAIGESIDYGIWIADRRGQDEYISESMLRLTGMTLAQYRNQGWLDAIHPDDRERCRVHVQESIESGRQIDIEYRMRGADGQWHPLLGRGVAVRDEAGQVRGWAGINLDIGRLKRVEDELRAADNRKNEFLAVLAHELRNPLAPIRNGLEVLRMAPGNEAVTAPIRQMMERQLGHMVRLIDDLLDLSRITQNKIELRRARVDLADVINSALETSRPLIDQSGHQLLVSLPSQPVLVEADTTRLAQVFANLLNNAAKYTRQGGRISLTVRRQGASAVVSVEDDGVGIPVHMLPHVFEMFTQVDRSLERATGGLGIGLSISRRLVEMHGGAIEVRSQGDGKGSEFLVTLPILSPAAAQADAAMALAAGPEPTGLRILVVDDNADSAASMAIICEVIGNQVRAAHDGLQAIQAAESFRPQVILMDIGMPRLNGYEACRRLRETDWGRTMTIVALTGWGQDEDRRQSAEAGFDHHLVKPVSFDKIKNLLAEVSETARPV